MNIIPAIPFTQKFDREAILETALKMVNNFNSERAELLAQLNIVLSSNSPFFIQRVLQDDPVNIKDPKNIEGRLGVAKIQAEQALNQYYWTHLWSITSDFFYPKLISNFNSRYYFTSYMSWGGITYLDFNLDNVSLFLNDFVFKPYSKEIAYEIIKCSRAHIEIHPDNISIKPFTTHCNALNRFITAADVTIALLFLKYGDCENWLEFSRKTTFALNDLNRKHELFHLIQCKKNEFAVGAQLDVSFNSVLNILSIEA